MNNLEVNVKVKELFYPSSSSQTYQIRLIFKKICINTGHELEKYENKASYPLSNQTSKAAINSDARFLLNRQFELRSTQILVIFIGVRGGSRKVDCLGEVKLDLLSLCEQGEAQNGITHHHSLENWQQQEEPKSFRLLEKLYLEKTSQLNANHPHPFANVEVSFSDRKPVETLHQPPSVVEVGVLKTEGYYKQELYISRRRDPEEPSAYEISRRNYKQIQVVREDRSSSRDKKDTNGSYKRRFEYEMGRSRLRDGDTNRSTKSPAHGLNDSRETIVIHEGSSHDHGHSRSKSGIRHTPTHNNCKPDFNSTKSHFSIGGGRQKSGYAIGRVNHNNNPFVSQKDSRVRRENQRRSQQQEENHDKRSSGSRKHTKVSQSKLNTHSYHQRQPSPRINTPEPICVENHQQENQVRDQRYPFENNPQQSGHSAQESYDDMQRTRYWQNEDNVSGKERYYENYDRQRDEQTGNNRYPSYYVQDYRPNHNQGVEYADHHNHQGVYNTEQAPDAEAFHQNSAYFRQEQDPDEVYEQQQTQRAYPEGHSPQQSGHNQCHNQQLAKDEMNSISSINSEKESKYKMITEKLELIESKIKNQKSKYSAEHSQGEHNSSPHNQSGKGPHSKRGEPLQSQKGQQDSKAQYEDPVLSSGKRGRHSDRSLSNQRESCPQVDSKAPSPMVQTPSIGNKQNPNSPNGQQLIQSDGEVKMSEFTVNSGKNGEKQMTQSNIENVSSPKVESFEKGFEGLARIQSLKKKQSIKDSQGKNYLETQIKMLGLELQESQRKTEKSNILNSKLSKQLQQVTNERNQLKKHNEKLKDQISSLKDELIDSYKKGSGSSSVQEKAPQRVEESTQSKEKLLSEELRVKVEQMTKKLQDYEGKIAKANKQRHLAEQNIEKKEKLIDKLSRINEDQSQKIFSIQSESEQKISELDTQLEKLLIRNTEMEAEIIEFQRQLKAKENQRGHISANLEKSNEFYSPPAISRPSEFSSMELPKNTQKGAGKTVDQELENERLKSKNLEGQLRFAENRMRTLNLQIENLKLEKKDLEEEIDAIAMNDSKKLAHKGNLYKAERESHHLSENVKLENQALKEDIRLLQRQIEELSKALDEAIERANKENSELLEGQAKSQLSINGVRPDNSGDQKAYSLLLLKYKTLSKRVQIYENELRQKKNKMAEIINCVWKDGDSRLIDEIDRIMADEP